MKRFCINLRKARKLFTCSDRNKFFWTICLPFKCKITRKARAYLRCNRIKCFSDPHIEEVYANGDNKSNYQHQLGAAYYRTSHVESGVKVFDE